MCAPGAKEQTQAPCFVPSAGRAAGVCCSTSWHVPQPEMCSDGSRCRGCSTQCCDWPCCCASTCPPLCCLQSFYLFYFFGRVYDLVSPASIAESICDHFYTPYLLYFLFYIMHVQWIYRETIAHCTAVHCVPWHANFFWWSQMRRHQYCDPSFRRASDLKSSGYFYCYYTCVYQILG